MIDELLTKENLEFREKAKDIAERIIRPNASRWDKDQIYPLELVEELKKSDLLGVWIPEAYGGLGKGVLNLCILVEEFSRFCGACGVAYAVNALGSFPIIVMGTEEQKKKWLPMVVSGERPVAFCLSEKKAGSDAGSMKATAQKEGDNYILNGDKKWTTNGDFAKLYTFFGVTDQSKGARGISGFIVPRETVGFSVGKFEDKMGIRAACVNETHFRDAKIPAENLLGGREGGGFKAAMMTLDRARPGVAAQALGLAQGAFELARDFAMQRFQFKDASGKRMSIINHQSINFMLADMETKIESARQLVYCAAKLCDMAEKENIHPSRISKVAAMAKVLATDVATDVSVNAVQIFGGYGYVKEYHIEKYMRDAKITQIYEGTNQIQRLVIGRHIIRDAQESIKHGLAPHFFPEDEEVLPKLEL